MTTEQDVKDLAGLVGLVLVLITLFMGHREQALRELRKERRPQKGEALSEFWFTVAIAAATVLVFVAGVGLWVHTLRRTVTDFGFVKEDHALTTVFAIVWLFLIPLIAWQLATAVRAWRLRAEIDARFGPIRAQEGGSSSASRNERT